MAYGDVKLELNFDSAEEANAVCDALPRAVALLRTRRYDEPKAELVELLHRRIAGQIHLQGIADG